jgi:hypothetical protein
MYKFAIQDFVWEICHMVMKSSLNSNDPSNNNLNYLIFFSLTGAVKIAINIRSFFSKFIYNWLFYSIETFFLSRSFLVDVGRLNKSES